MIDLPVRGPGVRELGLPLPPQRMRLVRGGRLLKRWRWVGAFGHDLMLCVGHAHVGPVPQRWWAIALPDGTLREGTRSALAPGRVSVPGEIDLAVEEGDGVEVVSPGYIWTRKQAGIAARGTVMGRPFEGRAFIDDSAGYHAHHTAWYWSAGVGVSDAGEPVAWNLVDGVHDAPKGSERSVWRSGEPYEVGPVEFAPDLSRIGFAEGGELRFSAWAEREENRNLLVFRSRYRQPFGTFAGELPGGLRLASGQGVMEQHDVLW